MRHLTTCPAFFIWEEVVFYKMMKKRPNVDVTIIFRYKDKALILKHKNGAFSFPGGRMEWGESIFGALDRELKEELDYSLDCLEEEPKLLDAWNYISKDGKRHEVFLHYTYRLNEKPELSSPEGHQLLWLTKDEMKKQNIIKDPEFLSKIFRYKREKN